jgi:hypothetical protein
MTIDAYLEAMKERFVTDPLVTQFQVIRERSTLMDGYLRARLALADGSQLEFSDIYAAVLRWDNCGDHL